MLRNLIYLLLQKAKSHFAVMRQISVKSHPFSGRTQGFSQNLKSML